MSNKKFIISMSCALLVLIVLSVFTIVFVGAKTHRTALLGTWTDANQDDLVSVSITFNQDDTYNMTVVSIPEGALIPETTVTEGTFSIFNGKIKMTSVDGKTEILNYSYDKEMHVLNVDDMTKTN